VLFLGTLVEDFAQAMVHVDAGSPRAASSRSPGRVYQPGIGPHSEAETVRLVMTELARTHPDRYADYSLNVPYTANPRQRCDLRLGDWGGAGWAVETKLARFRGGNGKPADAALMHLLSPYPEDRSAVTDCLKSVNLRPCVHMAVLIFGYEHEDRPLGPAITAFEALANVVARLGSRHTALLDGLIHPVHRRGAVFAWQVLAVGATMGNIDATEDAEP
jgi:hypothetical protein